MSANSPRILIGITTHNRAGVLPKAIASALSQQNVDVVVAVHDDASTDETPTLAAEFPLVDWTRSETLVGYRTIRNQWMNRPEFDYFVSLDDDAWFLSPTALETALARFNTNLRLGAIAFDILSPDKPTKNQVTPPIETFMFIGCGHMLRLTAVAEAGYYAKTPGPYGGEERDLALRLVDQNYRIEFLGGIHVWHDKTPVSRDLLRTHTSGVCNELCLTLYRCPQPDIYWVLPIKILNFFTFWIKNPKFFGAGLKGLGEFSRNFIGSLKQRSPVQRSSFLRVLRKQR